MALNPYESLPVSRDNRFRLAVHDGTQHLAGCFIRRHRQPTRNGIDGIFLKCPHIVHASNFGIDKSRTQRRQGDAIVGQFVVEKPADPCTANLLMA